MRSFDPSTQLSLNPEEEVFVTPAREGLPALFNNDWRDQVASDEEIHSILEYFLPHMNPSASSLFHYLPKESIILLDEKINILDAISEFEGQALEVRESGEKDGSIKKDAPLPYLTLSEILDSFEEHTTIDLGQISSVDPEFHSLAELFSPGPRFGGQIRPLIDHIAKQTMKHDRVVVVSRQAPRLADVYSETTAPHLVYEETSPPMESGSVFFVKGALAEGWTLHQSEKTSIHLLTDAEIFGWARPRPRRRPIVRASAPEAEFSDLAKGEIVVHVDYGIGRFQGLVQRTINEISREYLLVEYSEGDQVYVPIHQADRITRYVGADGVKPKFSRLGTQEWDRVKTKAKKAVEEIARDLLELYASRRTAVGHAFSPDSAWQGELEASFPYIETDQLKAIQAVKRSMEKPQPMDILVCGDAGYGKTEVALRASFKAVMDGKQVAMLVPTTVLAQQHFNTFQKRLAAFPLEVEMLSRFRSRSEIKNIVERITNNEVDIVIGTHRLLQPDIAFKDLGLLIIDEEQRFGVTHKEYLKKKRTEVDVLTMTATPIPRTLYMALTGARDISTINTPPEERLPAISHVGPYEPNLIRQAILRELDRGGQTFFVHNRVMTIEGMKRRLVRLVPEAKFAVAHGQMPEAQLAEVMAEFSSGQIDVLISTSIIESGLDIPNANTLIVDRADRFGLAQLYQLRGRVGRGAVRAYAYFLRHPTLRVSEDAYKRLEVFVQYNQLGAGYSIAMRDLELRGAGDILGTRQHGHISAIGFHLYTRLLATAVRNAKTQFDGHVPESEILAEASMPLPVAVELPIASAIPSDYVPDRELRLQLYRRLAEFRTVDEIEQIQNELSDRFGDPPQEVINLIYQLKVRIFAAQAHVNSVSTENNQILIQVSNGENLNTMVKDGRDLRYSKRGLWLMKTDAGDWQKRLLEVLAEISKQLEVGVNSLTKL
jgi:transcription-repair coupling factor (superfamily II helicase)